MNSYIVRGCAFVAVGALLAGACTSGGSAVTTTEAQQLGASTTSSVTIEIPTVATTAAVASTVPPSTTPAPLARFGPLPLTGDDTTEEAVLSLPVLAAKIDNVDAARPQAGLSQADFVYEEIVEGGLTRLLALFQSSVPDEIGPIRSARSTDVPLLTPLREPIFAWSGANAAFASLIRSVAIRDFGVEAQPDAYFRADDRPAPSDLMVLPRELYDLVELDGDLAPNPIVAHLTTAEKFSAGTAAGGVVVNYGATVVRHDWDDALAGWARTQDGTPHVDSDGDTIAPENVIVQFVTYRDSGHVDASGAVVPEAVLEGSGEAWIFSNGRRIAGSWTKVNVTAASQYFDAAGAPITLGIGRTWVLLARDGTATLL